MMIKNKDIIPHTEGAAAPFAVWIPIDSGPPTYTAQQRRWGVRGGHPYTYSDSKAKAVKSELTALLLPHAPQTPFSGPVRLEMRLIYPYRRTDVKAAKTGQIIAKSTRPDLDNTLKLLQDVMTKTGYWYDDAQIADLHVTKTYGPNPGIGITIEIIE